MQCKDCEFYDPINNDEDGYCRGTFARVYPDEECIWDINTDEEQI